MCRSQGRAAQAGVGEQEACRRGQGAAEGTAFWTISSPGMHKLQLYPRHYVMLMLQVNGTHEHLQLAGSERCTHLPF